jgi:DNA-directed RNA polymerase specialized sigma24 family protein
MLNGHFWGLQDAFVRLHRKRSGLRDPNATLAYLRALVCNLSRSRLGHLRMARRTHAQLAMPDDARSAEHQAAHREDIRGLRTAPVGRRLRNSMNGCPRSRRSPGYHGRGQSARPLPRGPPPS